VADEQNLVSISVVPHDSQRYDTCGDWFGGENIIIRVSDTGDRRSNLLVALHEFVEAILCEAHGVAEEDVCAFDIAHPDLDEPGEAADAPYHYEHVIAEVVERLVAVKMPLEWAVHAASVAELDWRGGK
jgi:hypothetical protein